MASGDNDIQTISLSLCPSALSPVFFSAIIGKIFVWYAENLFRVMKQILKSPTNTKPESSPATLMIAIPSGDGDWNCSPS